MSMSNHTDTDPKFYLKCNHNSVSTESNKRRVTKNKDEFGGIFLGEREESFVTLIIRTYSKFCNENYKMIDFY